MKKYISYSGHYKGGLKVELHEEVQEENNNNNTKLPSTYHLKSTSSSGTQGSDGHSLLCAESMLSTSPSDDLSRYAATDRSEAFPYKPDRHPLLSSKYTGTALSDHKEKSPSSVSARNNLLRDGGPPPPPPPPPSTNQCNSVATNHSGPAPRHEGNGAGLDRRMNSNGLDRGAMTGSSTTTSDTLPWLGDATVCQSQAQRPSAGILTSSIAGAAAATHDHLMLGSVFRPSLTLPEPPSGRLFAGSSAGQYTPIYTTSVTTPYAAPAYAHSQSSSLSSLHPFNYYPQYGYSHGSTPLLTGSYQGLDPAQSYSTVLAAMGSQFQHAQSQLPRTPFLQGPLPHQFGSLTPTNSPGPAIPRPLTPSQTLGPSQGSHPSVDPRRDEKSPKIEHRDIARPLGGRMSPPKDTKLVGPIHSPHHTRIGHSMPKDSSSHEGKDSQYKVPYMPKDNRSKHRYLSRTHEGEGRPSFLEPKGLPPPPHHHHSQHHPPHHHQHPHAPPHAHLHRSSHKSEEPPGKRSKSSSYGSAPPAHSGHTPYAHPQPPIHPSHYPSHPHYPPHFMRGSIIQLANGELKRVEDLRTDDFVHSADVSGDLKIDHSQVVKISEEHERGTAVLGFSVGEHRIQVTVEATLEHPFFVFGQGWSSCQPDRTLQRYGLSCHKLAVGDVCISLTHKDANSRAAEQNRSASLEKPNQISESGSRSGSGNEHTSHKQKQQTHTSLDTQQTHHHPPRAVAAASGAAAATSHTTNRQDKLHTSTPLAPSSRDSRTTSGDEAVSSAPGGGGAAPTQRKRRWSAPDQISVDTGQKDCDTLSPSSGSSGSNAPMRPSQPSPKTESKTQA